MTGTLANCRHCGTPYHWEKSGSALRLTYCGILCEEAGLGFSIVGLIRSELRPGPAPESARAAVAA